MAQFQALIFDMDGVIIDSEALHAEAKRIAMRQYGVELPQDVIHDLKGMTDEAIFEHLVARFLDGAHPVAEVLAAKHRAFRQIDGQVQAIPGALEFVAQARPRFSQFALTTSATRENQQRAFERFALSLWFDVVVTGEDITRPKPDPEPYLKTLEKMGLPASACLVIEDSLNGVRSGLAAGCAVAAITTTFSTQELAVLNPDIIITQFDELAEWLNL